ncbi:hypothetical protein ATANTOWER_013874 [Ataeniobius toweri]|uniref:Uncharacterized protein n=1 Tax=Ataeniobius toweri TaxID=208326 RepID=A0ABU7BFK2_9TELE|nr:hypothetical protein [Ataeniobius toweri]
MKLPQPERRSEKSGSACKFAPRFICPACPPYNINNHLRKLARTAHSPTNLSLRGLPAPSWNLHPIPH